MREWISAHGLTACGYCAKAIADGQPVQVIHIAGLKPRFRCQEHAEGPVDWQAVQGSKVPPARTSRPESGFARVSMIKPPIDVKALQAGDK